MARHRPVNYEQTGLIPVAFDEQIMPERNVYICKNNQELRYRTNYKIKNITYAKYICRYSACRECALRTQCLRDEKTRYRILQKPLHAEDRNYSLEMKKFIDTPEGRKLYAKRMQMVEPVFGNIRACKGLDRFTLRGKGKCNIQWVLFNMVHNICNHRKKISAFHRKRFPLCV